MKFKMAARHSKKLDSSEGISASRANTTGSKDRFEGISAGRANTTESKDMFEGISARRANTTESKDKFEDSWDFYRMVCRLFSDRKKYDEIFRHVQLDPVYPYFNSMIGINDPGDDGFQDADKRVMQEDLAQFEGKTDCEICQLLLTKAKVVLPSLVKICQEMAASLDLREVGAGNIKELSAALGKAETKYDGDVLKITDYCRTYLVVEDMPTLLALLELVSCTLRPQIRRLKLSSLKSDHKALPGGYRDCKINLEVEGHICEIQVHLKSMWELRGLGGHDHYVQSKNFSVDSVVDPYISLDGIDHESMFSFVNVAEEITASDTPLSALKWQEEECIMNYFAKAGLYLKFCLVSRAEKTLRKLIELRCENPRMGPDHYETLFLQRQLLQVLRQKGEMAEANLIEQKLPISEDNHIDKHKEFSLCDSLMVDPKEAWDALVDPSKGERELEERAQKEVEASESRWCLIRDARFKTVFSKFDQHKTRPAD